MYVDKKSPIPVYYQLKNIILKKIQDGEFAPGNLIPSERDLGENLNISRMTVRQALNLLVLEGALYRIKGRGTFVSHTKLEQRNIMSFTDVVRMKGLIPRTEVLCFDKKKASQDIKEILDLQEGEIVYVLKRLRLAGNMPVGIEEDFIPEKYCPGLESFDLTASLNELIKIEYDHPVSHVDNVIEASKPSKEERELLDISANIPVLRIASINYLDTNLKFSYERASYRSDEYKYSVRVYVARNIE